MGPLFLTSKVRLHCDRPLIAKACAQWLGFS